MYRVFGCSGGLETDLLVAAMDRASGSGADVVSISIGAAYQFWGGEDGNPYAQIASAIESKNIALVIASGNNGSLGPWRPTQPGTGAGSIAAGSIANTIFPTIYTGTDSRNASFQYSSVWPLQIPDGLNLVVAGQNASATDLESRYGCSQVTYNQIATTIQDQNQTIVAVRKGGCWSGIKWLWAEEFGFKYLLEYMPEDEMSLDVYDREIYSDVPMKDFTGITVTADTSDTILQGALADANYRVYFGNGTYTSIKSLIGGLMSNYSSVGPTAEGDMKPQLSAPGGNILSTWPLEGGGYAIISGTSMATPFLAGCFALAKSLYPEAKVRDLKALLQSTSKQIPWAYDENIVVSVASQGAGAVQIDRVQQPSATFNVGEFNLHSVEELQPQELTIRNPTTQSVTYSISHQGAGLVTFRPNLNTTQATGQYFGIQTNPTVNLPFYATSSPNSNSITLEPGTSTTITITFSPPNSGISDLQLPVYSGFIDITTDAEEKYSIPYLGIDYDRAAANPIYIGTASNTVLPVLSDTSTPLTTYKTFTLNSSLHPSILFINSQPTKGIRVELVPANTSFIPDFWYNGHVTPDFPLNGTYLPSALETKTFAGAETFGLLFVNGTTSPSFKTVELTGTSKVMTDVEVKDTTEVIERKDVPDGDYRMLLRVLKWNGNRTSKEGWESWMSAAFGIRKGG